MLRNWVNLLEKWPGEKYFGPYRFLPIYFVAGATLEYLMIHWRPNGINFYDKFKERKSREIALHKYRRLQEIRSL